MSIPTRQRPSTTIDQSNNTHEDILYYIQEGESKINFGDFKNKILILGNTGSGKSTFTQYLAGDNDNLISQAPNGQSRSASGKYIISDNNTRISESTINSKTILPELVLDTKTNTAFYDCPGFSDTRSATIDIASTYFTKKLMDRADALKLIFTVNHSSVIKGNDRGDFITLVKHITTLIKDINKFKDSIVLIATKVNNIYVEDDDGNLKLVSDNVEINDIAQFLNHVKNDMLIMRSDPSPQEQNLCENEQFCKDAIKLIDILLSQKGENYTKLGIFRRPNKPGPLSQIKLLQKGKRAIEKMLYENTKYTVKNEEDFGYTISESSKNSIYDLVIKINEQITSGVTRIGQEIQKNYRSKVDRSKDLYQLKEKLNSKNKALSKIIDASIHLSKPKEFAQTFANKINNIYSNVYIIEESNKILKQNDYLDFLQLVSNKKLLDITPLEWTNPLRDTKNYLNHLNDWYSFLVELYEKLSTYEIQKDVDKYNVANLEEWGRRDLDHKSKGIRINRGNLKQFLQKLNGIEMKGHDNVKNMEVDDFELEELNNILNITLRQAAQSSCLPGRMVVKGENVKFSDLSTDECGRIKFLEIYALNTVFIDNDFEQVGKKLQLTVIAPKWEVINTKIINLNGESGSSQPKAMDGLNAGDRGEDGNPGLPGGAAGNFLGIGSKFINSEDLTITANGGPGGPGQDGGNGQKGHKGETPPGKKGYSDFNQENTKKVIVPTIIYNHFDFYYNVYGKPGGIGGNGGNGGVGGLGGANGSVTMLDLNTFTEINKMTVCNKNGTNGIGGKGGDGGEGGDYGDTVETSHHSKIIILPIYPFVLPVQPYAFYVIDSYKSNKTGESGDYGTSNYNSENIQQPEPELKFQEHSLIVSNYKDYLMDHLSNKVKNKILTKFLVQLNEASNLTILDFIYELQILENKFHKFKDEIEFLPFYQSLLSRIYKYVENLERSERFTQNKKVLNYLYTATLSKICRINDNLENNLIIDIMGYFNSVIIDITNLQKITDKVSIDDYNKGYKSSLDKKIDEAKDFINKMVITEINNIHNEMDDKVESLIDETLELQREVEKHKEELLQKQKELNKALGLGILYGVLKGIGQVLGFLGSWGAISGGILGTTSTVAESFTLDNNYQPKELVIPRGIKSLLQTATSSIQLIRNKKNNVLEKQINILSQEIQKFPNQLAETKTTISNIQTNLTALSANDKADLEKITALENELKQQLITTKKELENKKEHGGHKFQKALNVIRRVNQVAQLAEISTDIYLKYKDDQAKLDEISNAIKQSENKLNQLKQYEKEIYSIIIPVINNIQDTINNLELGSSSKVALDVTKWQIQSSLRDIKLQMHQFTKGFAVQDNLGRCIEKLDESIDILINIYNRMQNYQEHKMLADYIANVNSISSNKITINNKEHSKAINKLELIIKSNIILDRYEKALNAFKQYIFPFADLYLGEFNLPSDLTLNSSIEDLANRAGQKTESLKIKLTTSDTSIMKHDKYLFKGDFNSNKYNTIKPFFIWENKIYKDTIAKLLDGEEVSLKADITKGVNENAIKFNVIEIYFKSINNKRQNDLDTALKYFDLQMTHLGLSLYRCNDKFYVITSDSQTISYKLEKNDKGDPVHANEVYEKIKRGNLMLSPYTMWNIKLITENETALNEIKMYKNQVDLHLVGHGQYVKKNYNCDPKLENYYKVDDTVISNSIIYDQQELEENEIHTRSIRETNDYDVVTNGASRISAPLGTIFKWVIDKLTLIKVLNPFNHIQDWLTGNIDTKQQNHREQHQNVPNKNTNDNLEIDPTNFYNQIDSLLVLAPVVLHVWRKNFPNKVADCKTIKYIDVRPNRIKLWQNLLEDAQQVVEMLQKNLTGVQLELDAFIDVIATREENIKSMNLNQIKIDANEVAELEKSLLALQVDLEDEIKYNRSFSEMKQNKFFIQLLNKLKNNTKQIPEYARKLDMVKLNYSQYRSADEEQSICTGQLETPVWPFDEFIDNHSPTIELSTLHNFYKSRFDLTDNYRLTDIEYLPQ